MSTPKDNQVRKMDGGKSDQDHDHLLNTATKTMAQEIVKTDCRSLEIVRKIGPRTNAKQILIIPRGVDHDPDQQNERGIPQTGRTGNVIETNIHGMICQILELGLVALKGLPTTNTIMDVEIDKILGLRGTKKIIQYFATSLTKMSCQIVGMATRITQVTRTDRGKETEGGTGIITDTEEETQRNRMLPMTMGNSWKIW